MDWQTKVLYVGHTYTCSEGDGKERRVGKGEAKLELECTEGGVRCLSRERRTVINATTAAVTNPECGKEVSWEVEEHGKLYEFVPGRGGKGERLFVVRRIGGGARYECFDRGSGEEVVREGKCNGGEEGTEVSFRYRSDRKVLTVREKGRCGQG